MKLHGAVPQWRSDLPAVQRDALRLLARRGLLPGQPEPGDTLPTFLEAALQRRLTSRFPAAACPRLHLSMGAVHATLTVTYEAPLDFRTISQAMQAATPLPWLHSALAHLSVTSWLAQAVWTPYDTWHHYLRHWGDVASFRQNCAAELQVAPSSLSDTEVEAWAETHSLLHPWAVARQLRLDPDAQVLSLPTLAAQAPSPLHRRIVEGLTTLKALDRRVPARFSPPHRPLPQVILALDGDEDLTLELASEFVEYGRPLSPTLSVAVEGHPLRVFTTYVRSAHELFRTTDDLLTQFQDL
ncbi:hypothetical protein GO986_12150 [Deinococcus sp. HMF7620]|uniref:Uncharacterized protein n=1 Tax=Deinococcus arboris TaxID=2682977 RepID=A0A7C9LMQ3_9DEIO|nr:MULTISPECIES: hypothetical protein [Deinococcus]MBZ9752131.1 hypothetical protein [Deinococcus betulae]MVN87517.1 hypothetical protein [Deinococcus arboris]